MSMYTAGTTTSIPAAFEAFVQTATLALVGQDVAVFDGPPRVTPPNSFVALTGWEGANRQPATFGSGNGFFSIEEDYELTGVISVWSGDSSYATPRFAALNTFATIETAVRADPTLGGVIRVSWLSRSEAQLVPDDKLIGSLCTITFALHCEARLS